MFALKSILLYNYIVLLIKEVKMVIKKIGTIDITPNNNSLFRFGLSLLDSVHSDVPKNKSNYIDEGIKSYLQEMLEIALKQNKFINTLKGGTNVRSNRK
jgi:predicted DNA-binding protein